MRVKKLLSVSAVFLMVSAYVIGAPALSHGQCLKPSAEKQAEVTSYVMKKYHVGTSSGLMLAGIEKETGGCFWRIRYSTSAPSRQIDVVLTPDGEHLVPAVYDLKVDPLAEEKQKNLAIQKDLTNGSLITKGEVNAPVTIVEFSDFQCPYCKRLTEVLEQEVLPKNREKVKIVFRSFPLPIHSWAKQAAVIAECAELQNDNAFWSMHDYFFKNQQLLRPDTVKMQATEFATSIPNLDQTAFHSCVDRDLGLGPVLQDQELGQKYGIHGTPTFFVNGVRFDGAHTAAELESIIDKASSGQLTSNTGTISIQSPAINIATVPAPENRANECAPVTR